jgi:hypothetical protein
MFENDYDVAETGAGFSGLPDQLMNIFMKGGSPFENLQKALDMQKAFEAGYGVSPSEMTGAQSFRMESLESAITSLIYNEKSTVLANDLLADKQKADSTVLEYSTLDDIGEAGTFVEGGAPMEEDDDYSRRYKTVKYIGAIGAVTNPLMAMSGNTIVNAREEKIRVKNLAIKRKLNLLGYYGDDTTVSTEFEGMLAAVSNNTDSDHIIDLRGKRPTLEMFNQGVRVIENVAGYTEDLRLYMSPGNYENYLNELMSNKRFLTDGSLASKVQGLEMNQLRYTGGTAPIKKDMFLNFPVTGRAYPRRNKANNAFIATGDKAPAVPTITSVTPTADAASKLDAGTYDYAVVAVNKYGQSSTPATANGADILIANGQKAVFVIADGGSTSGQEATAFDIYRRISTSTTDTDFRFLFRAKVGTTIADAGQNIPGTNYMFLVQYNKDVLTFKQLLDLTLFPLATSVDGVRWLQRLYGTLMIKNPLRIVVFKNVGDQPNA